MAAPVTTKSIRKESCFSDLLLSTYIVPTHGSHAKTLTESPISISRPICTRAVHTQPYAYHPYPAKRISSIPPRSHHTTITTYPQHTTTTTTAVTTTIEKEFHPTPVPAALLDLKTLKRKRGCTTLQILLSSNQPTNFEYSHFELRAWFK
jgi:hypothetical protein